MQTFPLKTILSTFTDKNGNKLTLFNAAPVGGLNSLIIKILFLSLPFIEFVAIFNDYVYSKVGLVTQIVVYIVFMSIIMVIIFAVTYITRKNVVKKITPAWNNYFPDIDLSMVLAVGITPYSDFFKHYSKLAKEELSEDILYEKLNNSFTQMQEENKELLIAINKDNKNI